MAYIINSKKRNGLYYQYLCKSIRNGNKVKRITLKYLGKSRHLNRLPIILLDKCAICGSNEDLVVDHKIPLSKNGTNDIENLQCLCKNCNVKKGNR